jgi:hypothetical protein
MRRATVKSSSQKSAGKKEMKKISSPSVAAAEKTACARRLVGLQRGEDGQQGGRR